MPYLGVGNAEGGEKARECGKIYFEDGMLGRDDASDEEAVRPTNATGHVEAFVRKLTTILLVTHDTPVQTGQTTVAGSVLRSASAMKQLTVGDVNAVSASLRSYQLRVSREKMHVVLESLEIRVAKLVKGSALYTLGAALLNAWEAA